MEKMSVGEKRCLEFMMTIWKDNLPGMKKFTLSIWQSSVLAGRSQPSDLALYFEYIDEQAEKSFGSVCLETSYKTIIFSSFSKTYFPSKAKKPISSHLTPGVNRNFLLFYGICVGNNCQVSRLLNHREVEI